MNQRGKNKIWNVEYASSISTNSSIYHSAFRSGIHGQELSSSPEVLYLLVRLSLILTWCLGQFYHWWSRFFLPHCAENKTFKIFQNFTVTSMLVTDVWNEMRSINKRQLTTSLRCWWQIRDNGDRFITLKQYNHSVSNILNLSTS